jgi:hypothetical protein
VRHRPRIRRYTNKGFVMGRKTGLEAGRAGPRSLFSVTVIGPCHRAVTAAATVSLCCWAGQGWLGFTVFCRTGPGGFFFVRHRRQTLTKNWTGGRRLDWRQFLDRVDFLRHRRLRRAQLLLITIFAAMLALQRSFSGLTRPLTPHNLCSNAGRRMFGATHLNTDHHLNAAFTNEMG